MTYRGLLAAALTVLSLVPAAIAQKEDASTIQGKVLVGYQGWFRCPGDGSPLNHWDRWFTKHHDFDPAEPAKAGWVVDMYPDTSDMDKSSICLVPGLKTASGKQGYVFSSFPKATTETHFAWMKQYNIDGAMMQRFVGDIHTLHDQEHDAILRNAIAAAEHNGRVLMIEYDISGGKEDTVFGILKSDWLYITKELKLTASPAYLREHGKPVVCIWGLGVERRITNAVLGKQVVDWFKNEGGATVMGGVPTGWETHTKDAQQDPDWDKVYASLDIVQPWTPGRFKTPDQAADWTKSTTVPDLATTTKNHQLYMPVIFPGFSWHNVKGTGDGEFNKIPRQNGALLWAAAMDAKAAGATMVKIAMFDEVNESTAILKAAPTHKDAPASPLFVTMDQDGKALPSDWYLRLAGEIARVYHGDAPVGAMPANPLPNVPR